MDHKKKYYKTQFKQNTYKFKNKIRLSTLQFSFELFDSILETVDIFNHETRLEAISKTCDELRTRKVEIGMEKDGKTTAFIAKLFDDVSTNILMSSDMSFRWKETIMRSTTGAK